MSTAVAVDVPKVEMALNEPSPKFISNFRIVLLRVIGCCWSLPNVYEKYLFVYASGVWVAVSLPFHHTRTFDALTFTRKTIICLLLKTVALLVKLNGMRYSDAQSSIWKGSS